MGLEIDFGYVTMKKKSFLYVYVNK